MTARLPTFDNLITPLPTTRPVALAATQPLTNYASSRWHGQNVTRLVIGKISPPKRQTPVQSAPDFARSTFRV